MSENVKRYDPENGWDSVMQPRPHMKESPNGQYVGLGDYSTMLESREYWRDLASEKNTEIASLTSQLQEAQDDIGKLSKHKRSVFCVYCGASIEGAANDLEEARRLMVAHDRECQANPLVQQLASLCSSLSSEKARADAAEERESHYRREALRYGIERDEARAEVTRLTAEVEEWKKKAKKLENDVAFADGFATAAGQRNVKLMAELSEMHRNTVRVDVLLRWMQSRSRVLSILGGSIMSRAGSNPGEQARALLSWLMEVLNKHQDRSRRSHEGKKEDSNAKSA